MLLMWCLPCLHVLRPLISALPSAQVQGSDGSYSRTRSSVEFSQYMRDNGYHIIPIASKHQLVGGWGRAAKRNLSLNGCPRSLVSRLA